MGERSPRIELTQDRISKKYTPSTVDNLIPSMVDYIYTTDGKVDVESTPSSVFVLHSRRTWVVFRDLHKPISTDKSPKSKKRNKAHRNKYPIQ